MKMGEYLMMRVEDEGNRRKTKGNFEDEGEGRNPIK
ncbi:MAG: hypothetical protein CM15mP64_6250 [Candidatus Neomarinimicrobiota bacterium]|nr:MAG: hypothetical protein CM15mP64_6250 [Candidatus Neomarinimicrobiota bacterium]